MISRRDFLKSLVAVAAVASLPASAIARMPVLYGDGEHDDTEAINAAIRGDEVIYKDHVVRLRRDRGGGNYTVFIPPGTYYVPGLTLI